MIQNQVNKILAEIDHLQNGDVSKSMENMGLKYGTNFGVSLLQLKGIASKYTKNNELAYALLGMDVREAKILSSMLFDESKITFDQLLSISTAINNIELVEQFSRNLFSKTADIDAALPVIIQVDKWQQVLALFSASWAIKLKHSNSSDIVEWAMNQLTQFFNTTDSVLRKGVFMLMQSMASYNSKIKDDLMNFAKVKLTEANENSRNLAQDFLLIHMEQ